MRIPAIPTLALGLCLTVSCRPQEPQVSQSGASQITNMFQVPTNIHGRTVEQQNIDDRIRVTTDPTKVLWIHLIALDGKIIRRMPVRSKVTSSGKRLEPRHISGYGNGSNYHPGIPGTPYTTNEMLQPDGTYGNSDSYIYWFDPMGRYHQYGTAGGIGYLVTDYPIDLVNPIEQVTGLYNADKAAAKWQKEQEKLMEEKEEKTKTIPVTPAKPIGTGRQ